MILRMRSSGSWVLVLVAAVSCSEAPSTPAARDLQVSSLAVTAAAAFTSLGQRVQLTATATLTDGSRQDVTAQATWQSSNAGVVSVSASGLATSVAEGDARVSATYQAAVATSEVVVRILWSIQGRVLGNPDRAGVSGAAITVDGAVATSGMDGAFTLQGPGVPISKAITVEASGFVTRRTFLAVSGARTGVPVDLISLGSPFSLTFYRQLVRGAADNGAPLLQIFRWERPPSFFIRTSNGSSEMPPAVIAELAALIPSIVEQVTGGRLTVPRVETGSESRPITPGWINVEYTTAISSCGLGTVGGGLAQINPNCSCLSSVGVHEITHVLGFWHHSQPGGLMSRVAPTRCSTALSDLEAYHTKVAYSRPRGNTDPDTDPVGSVPLGDASAAEGKTVTCWPIR